GEDITHSVLTQINFELENNKNGQNLLPIPFLRQIISYYGDQMEMVVPSFLEQTMQLFAKEQARMREQMQNAFGGKGIDFMEMVPTNLIEEQTKRNLQMFQEAMRMFTPSPAPTPPASESRKEEKPQSGSPTNGDLQELREQLAAMQ